MIRSKYRNSRNMESKSENYPIIPKIITINVEKM